MRVAELRKSSMPRPIYSEARADRGAGRSNTNRHAVLRLSFLDFMQTMMRSTLGISELQSRNTSDVQALRSSSVPRAKLAVGKDTTQTTIPIAATRLLRLAKETAWLLLTTISDLRVSSPEWGSNSGLLDAGIRPARTAC